MNCDELKRALHDYVDQTLPAAQRADFERHVEACPGCKQLVDHVLELPCRDFVQFLDDYYEGSLPEAQRRVFQKHMELCPPCVDYLRTYQQTVRLGRLACSSESLPESVPDALVEAILQARRAEQAG